MKKYVVLSIICFILLSLPQNIYSSGWKGAKKVQLLNNGLTVIIKKDDLQPVVSVQVWVKVGAINENEKTRGLTHFLEHLIFKGTEKYPGSEISRKVETQGGAINAATSKEFTYYYINTQKNGLEEAVKIGKELKTGGYLLELKRTRVGDFTKKNSYSIPEFSDHWNFRFRWRRQKVQYYR